MRLMTAADRPEPLWLALRMVQVVLRASPSASDCWSRVTNPASMRDCPRARIFAACRDFISVTTDVPFRWDERWAWFRCALIVPSEHLHALRSRDRGCFLVVQTLWAEKIQSTTDAGSLNTFRPNEIEVAPISSALLRIACLVILYKTCRVPGPRTRSRWGISGT